MSEGLFYFHGIAASLRTVFDFDQTYLPILEWVGVAFNMGYVLLIWYEKKLCWLFGAIGSLLAMIHFQHPELRLYSESGLYAFYVFVSVYGWWTWSREDDLSIKELSWPRHLLIILLGTIMAYGLSWLTTHYTDAARPLADSLSTSFSLLATFLAIRKVLSNWIYWVFIDLFSVWLYHSQGADIYAIQMLVYTGMAVYGYIIWRKNWKQEASA